MRIALPKADKRLVFVLLCLANITISFNFAALAAVIPVMSESLGLPAVSVSRILHYYMIPYGLGALIYPPLTRRMTYKAILLGCMFFYTTANFVCGFAVHLPVILLSRIVMGIAAAGIIPLTLMIIGKFFEKEIRGRMVGLFFSTSFAASLVGIILSGMTSWVWLFIIPGCWGALTLAAIGIFSEKILLQKEEGGIDYWNVIHRQEVAKVFLYIFMISFLYHGVHKWLGVYLNHVYGLKQMAISFYFMVLAVSGAIGQNIGGYLTDKKGRFISCLIGVLMLSATTMLLYFKLPLVVLGVALGLFAIGWTIGHNGVSTILTDFPDEHRAEIAGLNSAVRFFSGGLGFFAGGAFVEKIFGLTFLGFGVLMLMETVFLKYIIPQDNTTKEARYA